MGPFPKSKHYEYILVVVDYISKWVGAMPCRTANAKHSKRMFEEIIFPRFGVPRMVISDGDSRVKLFGHGKLRSKWEGPFKVISTSSHGAVTLQNNEGVLFKVNCHHL